MNITYTGRKVNLRDNFKDRVEKKLSKFDKIFSDDATANVVVTLEKTSQKVEITIKDNKMVYRVEKTMPEMNDAVDKCIDALSRQLRKNKTKLEKRIHASSIDDLYESLPSDEEIDLDESEFEVVKSKQIPVKPISVEEAILQMNMVGHKFYMFTNADSHEVNVVYLRDDGKYGLLQPQIEE